MTKKIKDSDLLMGMEMMLDYEPTVYGFNGHYYYTNLSEESASITDTTVEDPAFNYDEHELDDEQGKIWVDNSLNENNLEEDQVKWLKKALWLYYY